MSFAQHYKTTATYAYSVSGICHFTVQYTQVFHKAAQIWGITWSCHKANIFWSQKAFKKNSFYFQFSEKSDKMKRFSGRCNISYMLWFFNRKISWIISYFKVFWVRRSLSKWREKCPYLGAMTFSIATFSITTFSITTLSITTISITTLSIITLSIMTLSIMTLSIMTLSITTLSIMTLSITTLSIMTLSITTSA
jgi:hypothetical protein